MRLQRYLALGGVASRRRAEEFIVQGRVRVNGKLVRELGTSVAAGDTVECDGKEVFVAEQRDVLVVHKPVGVVTTMRDPEGRTTIAQLLAHKLGQGGPRLVPVGRLDYDTSGLLLVTNDGDLAHALTHPRFGVEKVYRATLKGRLLPEEIARLGSGVRLPGLDDRPRSGPAQLRIVASSRGRSVVDITIHEGRNRQVRRMFDAVGHDLIALERLRFGPVSLGPLRAGEVRELTERERKALAGIVREAAGGEPAEDDE